MSFSILHLSKTLFWDVTPDSVDWIRHRDWLMQRVLERGTWEDWLLVSAELSVSELKEMEPRLRLAARERNFLMNWIRRSDAV